MPTYKHAWPVEDASYRPEEQQKVALADLDAALTTLKLKRVGAPRFATKPGWLIATVPVSRTRFVDYEAFVEDLKWMLDTGESVERALTRLDVSLETARRRLYRAGRSDLVARLAPMAVAS